jgi:hypothetical protein
MGAAGVSAVENMEVWYTVEQLEGIVEARFGPGHTWASCRGLLAQECGLFVRRLSQNLTPLGPAARASLASIAVEMGGAGAFHRFAEPSSESAAEAIREFRTSGRSDEELGAFLATWRDPFDIRELIATTAGVPADEVMAEWLARVLESRPDRAAREQRARLGAVAWILLFVAFSTRSTRWRLG